MYMTIHYLTVLCVSTTEHAYDISLPDSFCVCLLQNMYLTTLGIVPDIYLGLYLTFLGTLSGYAIFPGIFCVAILFGRPCTLVLRPLLI